MGGRRELTLSAALLLLAISKVREETYGSSFVHYLYK